MIVHAAFDGLGVIRGLISMGSPGLLGLNGIIGSAIGAALWWWLAMANRAGKRWARTTATVLVGINALTGIYSWLAVAHWGAFSASAFAATTGFALVLSLGVLLLGLATIALLWTRRSSEYFAARSGSGY
jgi:hypothetical protein